MVPWKEEEEERRRRRNVQISMQTKKECVCLGLSLHSNLCDSFHGTISFMVPSRELIRAVHLSPIRQSLTLLDLLLFHFLFHSIFKWFSSPTIRYPLPPQDQTFSMSCMCVCAHIAWYKKLNPNKDSREKWLEKRTKQNEDHNLGFFGFRHVARFVLFGSPFHFLVSTPRLNWICIIWLPECHKCDLYVFEAHISNDQSVLFLSKLTIRDDKRILMFRHCIIKILFGYVFDTYIEFDTYIGSLQATTYCRGKSKTFFLFSLWASSFCSKGSYRTKGLLSQRDNNSFSLVS